jgi:predicted GIY-YIG superfamily endonuclease
MREVHPLVLSKFHLHQITNDERVSHFRRLPVELGDYETWLWADEVAMCQELRCKVTIHGGYGWREWGVPPEWKPPLQFKERIFIYAFVSELTQEAYIGQTDNLERRWIEHLRDTKNSGKVALIQSIRAQGREPGLIQLEEVPGEKAQERERYWTSYYKGQGYKIINQDYRSLI